MSRFAELEIHLQRRDEQACSISFRYLPLNDDATRIQDSLGVFVVPKLRAAAAEVDPEGYGRKLSEALFKDAAVKSEFQRVRDAAPEGLRVRLVVPAELQALRWETLADPDPRRTGAPLVAGGAVFLSRYLNSENWNPARSRRKADLTALVVVANPPGEFSFLEDEATAERSLAPVDVEGELGRALEAMAGLRVKPAALVSDPASATPLATVSNIMAKLRPGIDILYLVCHGALLDGEPRLWLEGENPDKPYEPVAASELIRAIGDLPHVPRLIVLASCQSAGTAKSADGGVLAALGPRLIIEAGAGAVVAMQGNISMETVKIFLPEFFHSMLNGETGDGQMDRAMTVARGLAEQNGRADYWIPALFTRLQNGAIWYEPGFAAEREKFDWSVLCRFIKTGRCIPIIGPDLADYVFGSTASIARELAKNEGFPMSNQDGGDLAKVAQFIASQPFGSRNATLGKVRDVITDRFYKNAPGMLPEGVEPDLDTLAEVLAKSETDPLRIAAALNASVYVTASSDSLFEKVLAATPLADGSHREVSPLVMNWRDERRLVKAEAGGKAIYGRAQTEQFTGDPTAQKPCLYYLFGKRAEDYEPSWVLTEDDVVDYLIQTSKYDLLPQAVADALGSRSILFLGFPLDDWKFRVLFRMILAIEGNSQLGRFSHVGVQVDPDHSTLADVARAKRYLEDYYRTPHVMRDNLVKPKISIYWGTSADFLRQLHGELKTTVLRKSA